MSELDRANLNDVVAVLNEIRELLKLIVPLDVTSIKTESNAVSGNWTPPPAKPKLVSDETPTVRNVITAPPRAPGKV